MLCDINGINTDLFKVLNKSYNLIDKSIIYYGILDSYDVDRLIKRYERYGCKCIKKIHADSFVLEIDMTHIKVKNKFLYKIIDFFNDIVEFIGNLLVA